MFDKLTWVTPRFGGCGYAQMLFEMLFFGSAHAQPRQGDTCLPVRAGPAVPEGGGADPGRMRLGFPSGAGCRPGRSGCGSPGGRCRSVEPRRHCRLGGLQRPAAAPAPHKGNGKRLGGNGRCISGRGFHHGRAPRMFLTAVAQAAKGWPAGSGLHFLKHECSVMMGLKLGLKGLFAGFKESTKKILS